MHEKYQVIGKQIPKTEREKKHNTNTRQADIQTSLREVIFLQQ